MVGKKTLSVLLFSFLVAANAAPANVNVPITEEEWEALRANGLQRRDAANVNLPISTTEWQNLEAGGLFARDQENAFTKRDKVMNCGHKVTGKGGSNGHGKWIPVGQFLQVAQRFCNLYTGTDIFTGHETSETYPITLTNGDAGNIVFAIYNTERSGSFLVNYDTCYHAMKAPLGSHADEANGQGKLRKRDNCYGEDNHDYEGGYYRVNGIGAFGSEVYEA